MEDIHALLEVSKEPKNNRKSPIDSTHKIILKIIRDVFAFFFGYLASYMVLFAMDGMARSEREKAAILVLLILVSAYTLLSNLTFKIVAILYALAVFLLILYILDYRLLSSTHALILLGVIAVAAVFHFFKRQQQEEKVKKEVPSVINLSDFESIGTLEHPVDADVFIEKSELQINKRAYKNFKPVLEHKNTSNSEQIVLKYSNKDDLHFTLVITSLGVVYVKHWKQNEQSAMANKFIFEAVQDV